jgi:pimeloyl-ACP methyl ester carboxylesterase
MQEDVTFVSEGLKLSGRLTLPDSYKAGERRPAVIVLHGFGSTKNSGNVQIPCDMLSKRGYVTLGFDMRGCGDSEGEKGRVICLEQVADTQSAISFLQTRAEVDPNRIALLGSSFGAAVAVYTGSIDKRVGAVVSSGGWGNGERKFQGQHPSPEQWAKFTAMLEEGKRHREKTGQSLMVPRYDIVPIPEALRGHVVPGSIQMFPAETAQSMFDFKAEEVVAQMAPRPLLLLHSSVDSVTPTEQSLGMFARAGQPCELHVRGDEHARAQRGVRLAGQVFSGVSEKLVQ